MNFNLKMTIAIFILFNICYFVVVGPILYFLSVTGIANTIGTPGVVLLVGGTYFFDLYYAVTRIIYNNDDDK